jgi:hypothetical protein
MRAAQAQRSLVVVNTMNKNLLGIAALAAAIPAIWVENPHTNPHARRRSGFSAALPAPAGHKAQHRKRKKSGSHSKKRSR